MIPEPCIVCSNIRIKCIVSIGYQQFCCFKPFLSISSFFFKILAWKHTHSPVLDHALYAETKCNRKIRSASRFDLFYYLSCKTQAILQATAIFVLPLIKHGNRKLIQQISLMYRMDLYSVKACSLCIICSVSKRTDNTVDLLHRQRAAYFIEPAMRNCRWCNRWKFAKISWNRYSAETA